MHRASLVVTSALEQALTKSRLLSAAEAKAALVAAKDLVSQLEEIAARVPDTPSRRPGGSSGQKLFLIDLPDAVLVHAMQYLLNHNYPEGQWTDGYRFGNRSVGPLARTCSAMARIARDPTLYVKLDYAAHSLLTAADGDLGALFTVFSHSRFAELRELNLSQTTSVKTALVNKAAYRKALPQPAWNSLQHLWVRNTGVTATANCLINVLPPSLLSLSFKDSGKWMKPEALATIASRCPKLAALDLSWSKSCEPWPQCLDMLAEKLPSLLALDITYAGTCVGAGLDSFERPADFFERLLVPIRSLSKLRFLDLSYLGLDGSASHADRYSPGSVRSDGEALVKTVAELKDLKVLCTDAYDDNEELAIRNSFATRLEQGHPKLKVRCQNKRDLNLRHWCVTGKLWEA